MPVCCNAKQICARRRRAFITVASTYVSSSLSISIHTDECILRIVEMNGRNSSLKRIV